MNVGEANEDRHGRATRPCAPKCPRNTGVGQMYTMSSFKAEGASSSGLTVEIRHRYLQFPPDNQEELFQILRAQPLVRQLSVPEFGIALGLYTEDFMDENDLDTLRHHIHYFPSKCWYALVPGSTTYDLSHPKASALSPSLRTLREHWCRQHSRRLLLWSMANGHVLDLAYFIALAIRHQTEQHRRGVISIGPYLTRLAWHFELLNTSAQSSSQTLIGQISPQCISSMLNPEDITDDVPPRHKDPPSQPPPPSRPVHAAASYADIPERLIRFEQQCFQRFDNIDATLQQICQHFHISSPPPPREPPSDENV
ncbi:hypothetical protein PVK06_011827 [Gossypium arboreum]|uniref:Uncharacterized protein n=1 Tax=Gossypium arboreum TaxID=29729 RepID=A0ABR0QB24_GOSAR|nr:hypothetical protein PVK06_011827 [Gossypium arboreum]